MLVVRREAGGIRRYCHLGTGNYHPRTARAYTDYGLFTCDDEIGQDVHELFLQLTSLTQTPQLKRLLQSPFSLHETVLEQARARDRARARRAPGAHHRQDERAGGRAGDRGAVPRLARRGARSTSSCAACARCARASPACPRTSRVRSIVGRFLEHSRVFYFENGGEHGAVLRQRRLDGAQLLPPRRGGLPDPRTRTSSERILRDLELYLSDNCQAWQLQPDGRYERVQRGSAAAVSVQAELLAAYAAGPATSSDCSLRAASVPSARCVPYELYRRRDCVEARVTGQLRAPLKTRRRKPLARR